MQLKRKMEKRLSKSLKKKSLKDEAGYCAVFFTADTTYGPAGVEACMGGVGKASVKTSDALCALVLGVVEEKIQFVENWLRCIIDVEPGAAEPDRYKRVFTVRDKNPEGSSISFYLPVINWGLIPEFNVGLVPDNWEVSWAVYKGVVTVGRFHLSASDASSIKGGSIVLIPESFQDPWVANLKVPGLSVGMDGVFNASDSTWIGNGQLQNNGTPEILIEDDAMAMSEYSGEAGRGEKSKATVSYVMTTSAKSFLSMNEAIILKGHETGQSMLVKLDLANGKKYFGYMAPLANGYAIYINRDE